MMGVAGTITDLAKRFSAEKGGAMLVKFAMLTPILFGATAFTIDYSVLHNQQSRLQGAADAGALAAAKELGLSDAKTENVQAIVQAVVESYLRDNQDTPYGGGTLSVSATLKNEPLEVDVVATQTINLPFGGTSGISNNELSAHAVARIAGRPNVCVLGLDPSEVGTISLEQNALVTGRNCAVFSNSSHVNGLKSKNSARLSASLICSRGGKDGARGSFVPDPIVDCPSFDDPLAGRPEPIVEACLETDLVVSGQTRTLTPGTYCGGLQITNASAVTLTPGIYVIKDGPLTVDGGSSIEGENTGFFFIGAGATFDFASQSSISLTAPVDGPMAGLLMFEGRSQPTNKSHKIMSNDARVLLGTIYLPRSELRIDATSPIADESAYTAVVARTMKLYGGPHLVLNTNYDQTDVPVPEGIKGAGQPVALVE